MFISKWIVSCVDLLQPLYLSCFKFGLTSWVSKSYVACFIKIMRGCLEFNHIFSCSCFSFFGFSWPSFSSTNLKSTLVNCLISFLYLGQRWMSSLHSFLSLCFVIKLKIIVSIISKVLAPILTKMSYLSHSYCITHTINVPLEHIFWL